MIYSRVPPRIARFTIAPRALGTRQGGAPTALCIYKYIYDLGIRMGCGVADSVALTVVYTDRITDEGVTVRGIISARRSNRRERQAFREALDTR